MGHGARGATAAAGWLVGGTGLTGNTWGFSASRSRRLESRPLPSVALSWQKARGHRCGGNGAAASRYQRKYLQASALSPSCCERGLTAGPDRLPGAIPTAPCVPRNFRLPGSKPVAAQWRGARTGTEGVGRLPAALGQLASKEGGTSCPEGGRASPTRIRTRLVWQRDGDDTSLSFGTLRGGHAAHTAGYCWGGEVVAPWEPVLGPR